MKTLALFAAFLLLAFQAQAQTKHAMDQQEQNQYQAEVKVQDQFGTEDQNAAVTLREENHHSKGGAGYHRMKTCACQQGHFCKVHRSHDRSCKLYGTRSKLCSH